MAAPSNATRGFSNATPAQCANLTVSLAVAVNSTDTFYAIDEVPPSGWAITNPGTGDTQTAGHIKWIVITGAVNTTYNYSVGVPCNATGINVFSGEYGFDDAVMHNITGQTNVTVTAADTTAPSLAVSSPANTTYGSSSVNLNYTASDANGISACWYRLDNGANQSLASCGNTSISSLANGNHSVIVYARDTYGNTNTSTVYFSVGTAVPILAIQSPTNTTYASTTVNLNFTSDATVANCWYSRDGGANTTLPSCGNISMASLAQGNHSVRVAVNDSVGNANASIVYFRVDTVAPALAIQSPTNTTYVSTTVNLNFTADATVANCWYSKDGGTNTTLPSCGNISMASLAQGAHSVVVAVNDSLGNANTSTVYFSVDTVAPSLIIQNPQNITYNTAAVPLNYTVASGAANCWYSLNGGANTTLASCGNISLPSIAQGANTVSVYANDSLGNSNASSVSFFVDSISPQLAVSSPANTTYASTSINLNYTANDTNRGTCWYSLDGGTNTTLTGCGNTSITSLGQGNHSIRVTVNDTANNRNSSTVYFSVDTVAPALAIQSPTNSTYNSSTVALNFTAGGATSCSYQLDANAPASGCGNASLSALAQGAHSVRVNASDAAGNLNSSTTYFSVDTAAPPLIIQNPQNATYNTTAIPLNYTASGAIGCWYKLNGGANTTLASCGNISLPSIAQGANTVSVYANDSLGNSNASSVSFFVDSIYPQLAVSSPANTTYASTSINLNYTANDTNRGTCWYSLDGGTNTTLTGCGNTSITSLGQGNHSIRVTVNDTANNRNASTVYFSVDTVAPGITIQSPSGSYGTADVPVNYTIFGTDINKCWYRFNSGANVSTPGTCVNFTLYSVPEGTGHTLVISVNDTIGNTNSSTTYLSVDTVAPALAIQSPANTTYGSSSVNLNYTASDANGISACWYKLDNGANQSLASCGNASISSLANGNHSVIVYARDTYGNTNTSTVYFSVGTVAPALAIQSPTNTTYASTTVNLNFTSDTTVANCWYSKDGGANATIPSCGNISMASLAQGNHSVRVAVNDSVGNANASTVYFSVDTVAPALAIQNPTNTTYGSSSVNLNYTAFDANGISACWYKLDNGANQSLASCGNTSISSLANGNHSLMVYAKDTYGNTNTSTVYFSVDTAAPALAIQSPTNTTYASTTVNLNFTSDATVANCWYSRDGGANTTLSSCRNTTLASLAQGSHTIILYANDSAGNQNSSSVSFMVDTAFPTVAFVPPTPANGTSRYVMYVYINATSSENLNQSLLEWDGVNESMQLSGNNSYKNKTGLAYGLYTYRVHVQGLAGKWNSSEERAISVNESQLNVSAQSEETWTRRTLTRLYYNVSLEGADHAECSLYDAGGNRTASRNVSTGTYYFSAYARNGSGKYDFSIFCLLPDFPEKNSSANVSVYYDSIRPNITANFTNMYFNSTLLNLTYNAYDNLAPYLNCTLSAGGWIYNVTGIPANSSRTEEVNFTRQGRNSVRITCMDYTRNSGRLNAMVYIDTIAPNITIRSITPSPYANANGTRNTTISYYVYDRSALNITTYSIDGLLNGSLGTGRSFTLPLAPGNHSVLMDVWDAAFNRGTREQNFTVPWVED